MKFHAGDFSLNNAQWSGRTVEVDTNQIETLIENNQHSTTQEIVNILKISKSIKLLVKRKNVSCACFDSTYTKIGTIQRLAWPLCKDDMQIGEVFHIFIKEHV